MSSNIKTGAQQTRAASECIGRMLLEKQGLRLRKIAGVLISKAEKGDLQAIKEVMDRFEGRVRQQVELSGMNGGPIEVQDGGSAVGNARRVAFLLAQGVLARAAESAKEAAGAGGAREKAGA